MRTHWVTSAPVSLVQRARLRLRSLKAWISSRLEMRVYDRSRCVKLAQHEMMAVKS